jgi:hypothetical protein
MSNIPSGGTGAVAGTPDLGRSRGSRGKHGPGFCRFGASPVPKALLEGVYAVGIR